LAYKALYRTYRPQKFSEVIGQDHIVRTLQNSLASGKISHAYLFSGPRGTGKTSVARIFAKALNCTSTEINEPCGECVSCREIADSNSPDVVEIDAASNNGVDEIRDIREKVKFLPTGAKYKIYIIDEVHMLSQGAFNALLKTLEEPPKHVIFILATTEPHKVLPTILSRCQRFDFKALNVKEISDLIRKVTNEENFKISEEAIVAIAEGAEGGMRDALSYLDQAASFTDDEITIDDVNSVTGNLNYDKVIEIASYFEEKNINQALKAVSDLIVMGKEVNKVVGALLQFYRDVLLFKTIDTSTFTKYIYEKQEFKDLAKKIEPNKIFFYVDVLSDVQTKIKTSTTPAIYLDVAVIKMINEVQDIDFSERIKLLEDKLETIRNLDPEDGSKLNIIENKLTKVTSELSRLELPNLVSRINSIENNIESFQNIEEDLAILKTEIDKLKSRKTEDIDIINTDGTDKQLALIIDKVKTLEERIKKLNLKPKSQSERKVSRKKINEGQLVFYNDEVIPYHELDKKTTEERKEEIISEQEDIIINEKNAEENNNIEPDLGIIKLSDFEDNKEESEEEAITPAPAKAVSLPTTAEEEIIANENSQLVRRKKPIPDAVEDRPVIPEKPQPVLELEPEIETQPDLNPLVGVNDEEYNSYSVTVLERILHSSRKMEAREDKVRLINLWKSLTKRCSSDLLRVAQILQDGQIVAVGENEFVLVYPTTSLCNQVMHPKFKRHSLQLLYDVYGDVYNYMAIPDNIWLEKRTEYINQYNIGIKFPKLTPFDDQGLSVDNINDEISPLERLVNDAVRILGEDIVKIE